MSEAQIEKNDNDPIHHSFSEEKKYEPIRGWLLFFVIWLVMTFLLMIYDIIEVVKSFSDDGFLILTTPGSEYYYPLVDKVLYLELFSHAISIIFIPTLLFFLFKRKKFVPNMIIIGFMVSVILDIIDCSMIMSVDRHLKSIDPSQHYFDNPLLETFKRTMRTAIWMIYFSISKRVKRTFTH